jgi:hypothetical protein
MVTALTHSFSENNIIEDGLVSSPTTLLLKIGTSRIMPLLVMLILGYCHLEELVTFTSSLDKLQMKLLKLTTKL